MQDTMAAQQCISSCLIGRQPRTEGRHLQAASPPPGSWRVTGIREGGCFHHRANALREPQTEIFVARLSISKRMFLVLHCSLGVHESVGMLGGKCVGKLSLCLQLNGFLRK